MSTTEHKALELANRLQQDFNSEYINWDNVIEASAELRRLAAVEEGLRSQHDADSRELRSLCVARDEARRERDELRLQVTALQKTLPWVGNGVQCSCAIDKKDFAQ